MKVTGIMPRIETRNLLVRPPKNKIKKKVKEMDVKFSSLPRTIKYLKKKVCGFLKAIGAYGQSFL